MRWLFALLVVLNIGYVTWELNRERPQQVRGTALPKGVEPIVLVSERLEQSAERKDAVPVSAIEAGLETAVGTAVADKQPLSPEGTEQAPVKTALSQPAGVSAEPDQPGDSAAPETAVPPDPGGDLCYGLC